MAARPIDGQETPLYTGGPLRFNRESFRFETVGVDVGDFRYYQEDANVGNPYDEDSEDFDDTLADALRRAFTATTDAPSFTIRVETGIRGRHIPLSVLTRAYREVQNSIEPYDLVTTDVEVIGCTESSVYLQIRTRFVQA